MSKGGVLAFSLLLFCPVIALGQSSDYTGVPQAILQKIQSAQESCENRNFDAGIKSFRLLLQDSEAAEYYEIYKLLGKCQYAAKNYREALVSYQSFLEEEPYNIDVLLESARCKQQLKDNPGALALYDQIIRVSPNFPDALKNRGLLKVDLGDYKGAMDDLNRAIRLDNRYPAAFNARAELKIKLKDYESALEDAEAAIELNPEYVKAYQTRATIKRNLGDYQGALEDMEQAKNIYLKRKQGGGSAE